MGILRKIGRSMGVGLTEEERGRLKSKRKSARESRHLEKLDTLQRRIEVTQRKSELQSAQVGMQKRQIGLQTQRAGLQLQRAKVTKVRRKAMPPMGFGGPGAAQQKMPSVDEAFFPSSVKPKKRSKKHRKKGKKGKGKRSLTIQY